ncbi:PIN domain-containing protein [Pelotomaculum terephthalicicum JT]|uniref:PIN domain-containing protein n=1 Tax=Pelotomaculum TaxID=191373 RepID=UPI0009C740F1|nr:MULTISPECIES: PIN domain-containing protein [Pelotomaculum]MCG9966723.1 PIN domain-containing protein [Pelotomaculum terephthalicicum JT]OPX91419.1 MAG: tRNA(fMet)-specific endonuclease VapC [Pelotomaculum sp. PtaB.Bin117]OPY62955.1 MAG: tRNA(fMet)-specific endonuclease VapC [Pelotomaculum sp. PtaU1.Bin065]
MNANEGRQFVDTNIFVYAYDRGNGAKQNLARKLITNLWENHMGCVSIQVLQEFYVTVTKKVPIPLPFEIALKIISDLGEWTHHAPDVGDVIEAVYFQQKYGISFWDAMIVNSACKTGCTILWTEDLNSGQVYGNVTAQNPFDRED